MSATLLSASGDLFLGSDHATALAQGPRRFRTVANALRFAMEQAAPVSLHGASLHIGSRRFGPNQIRRLYRAMTRR
jgi:hypothetical protein